MKKLLLATIFGSMSAFAYSAECTVDLSGNDQMKYDLSEITISKSCKEFTINLKHSGALPITAMGHNVVISKATDKLGVATDGIAAKDNNYVKVDDARVLAASKVVGGGESTSVTFSTADFAVGGDYDFFCTFPGHVALMTGKVIVKD